MPAPPRASRPQISETLERAPVVGVVRTGSRDEALRQARTFAAGGIALIEITFTVPGATELVEALRRELDAGPPWVGMGTVTGEERARAAIAAGADFLVSPNVSPGVAAVGREEAAFTVLGALTPTEIVTARDLGADLVKVYPLPPVGGAAYLATVRQPLDDVPVLAAGGFGVDEIPAYRQAGARAFGIGGPLLAGDEAATGERIARALALGRGEPSAGAVAGGGR